MKRKCLLLTLITIVSLLAACSAPTPEVVEKEVIVEKQVPVTVVVEKEVIVKEKVVETVEVVKEVVVEKVITATPKPEPTKRVPKGTITTASFESWGGRESLDPMSPARDVPMNEMLYDPLVRLAEMELKEDPCLATSWEANEDATRWTFHLREGVRFHDGTSFDSKDVLYSFQHALDPDLGAPVASVIKVIDVENIETPDDYTVVFPLNEPHSGFPILLTDYRLKMLPEGCGDTIGKTGIGTGPFKIEEWHVEPGSVTVMVANEDYWEGPPGVARWEVVRAADAQARLNGVLAGEFDMGTLQAADIALFEGNPQFETRITMGFGTSTLVMNTTMPPYDDVRVRKAMKMVIDPQEMIDVALGGLGRPACNNQVIPEDQYYLEQDCPQDIEGAKALLAEAGYPDGLDVELKVSTVDPWQVPIAITYQEMAAKAGIRVDVKQVPADGYWTDVWLKAPFCGVYWGAFRDADKILQEFFSCGSVWNDGYWCNERIQELLGLARKEIDFEKRSEYYLEAQQIVADESGTIVPFYRHGVGVRNKRVKGNPPEIMFARYANYYVED